MQETLHVVRVFSLRSIQTQLTYYTTRISRYQQWDNEAMIASRQLLRSRRRCGCGRGRLCWSGCRAGGRCVRGCRRLRWDRCRAGGQCEGGRQSGTGGSGGCRSIDWSMSSGARQSRCGRGSRGEGRKLCGCKGWRKSRRLGLGGCGCVGGVKWHRANTRVAPTFSSSCGAAMRRHG